MKNRPKVQNTANTYRTQDAGTLDLLANNNAKRVKEYSGITGHREWIRAIGKAKSNIKMMMYAASA